MSAWKINLNKQTATSINGITFKLTETKPGEYGMAQICPLHLEFLIKIRSGLGISRALRKLYKLISNS